MPHGHGHKKGCRCGFCRKSDGMKFGKGGGRRRRRKKR